MSISVDREEIQHVITPTDRITITVPDDPLIVTSNKKSNEQDGRYVNKPEKSHLLIPILICIAIAFAGFTLGWDIGTIGGMTSMESFQNRFGTSYDSQRGVQYFPDLLLGLIISIFNIGCAVGSVTLAKLADWFGRKTGLYVTVIIYVIGLLIQIINDRTWIQFFIGRIVCGFAIGSSNVVAPMFLAEVAPVRIRGGIIVFYQIMLTFGILMGNIVNYACHQSFPGPNQNEAWKTPLGLGFAWACIMMGGIWCSPEPAPYLALKKGRIDSAKESFAMMNGVSKDSKLTDEFIEDMNQKMKEEIILKKQPRKWFEFVRGEPRLGYRVFIGTILMASQQLSGINYFFYYGVTLFKNAGLNDPYVAAIVMSIVNFVGTFGGIYLVERVGRKLCLVYGSFGMFCCMIVYSTIGSFALNLPGTNIGMIVVACIYIAFFATTLGPVTVVLVAELFPLRTKAISMATCSDANWLANFAISFTSPLIISQIGFRYGYVFAACLFFSTIFSVTNVPETKDKTTSEIDDMFIKGRRQRFSF
ncbi:Hxt14p NDAI_0G01520 [Naumovozyma dairenensis CBS 421]|uniref:Major facilitator superfamily (MFS) profile domain-containing protein n=1 Tax=Naumovozyma dairenensis (strain ATCC 10597 / BCRC 20456 / CBS 421 / NBRC 0211 / NRRL Y-12639) TaxID=1071378 RepID=G0WDR7_NAUDC|nr:hypothetical protein NDAI_0G01520 [Naumovozyma dairenensis CBS 421]CCD25928.2 hypothetical protein NDAI_0G01520 [Naumovozyma dairenensis CBS 421]